ncbi:MAG: hypothetical protein ACE5G5_02980 [Candidatus Methylomirabilales bacterium]
MTNEERPSVGRTLRGGAIWIGVVVLAMAAGFGGGYFLGFKVVQDRQQKWAAERAEMMAQISSLEKEVLQAQKSFLEQALARARLRAGMDEVLEGLTAALAEVEKKNFGRAMIQIGAAQSALASATGAPPSVRETVRTRLGEIRTGLEQLDTRVQEQMTALARDLENGVVSPRAPRRESSQRATPGGETPQ